jgi:hypothetical protein
MLMPIICYFQIYYLLFPLWQIFCCLIDLQILKDMLKANSLTADIQVVVADGYDPSQDILRDPQFAAAVDIIGFVLKLGMASNQL